MTTAAARRKTFDCKVSIATVNQDGIPYKSPVVVIPKGIIPNHGNYPVRISVKEDVAKKISPDVIQHIVIEQGNAKNDAPKYDTDYYWNIIEIAPYHAQVAGAQSSAELFDNMPSASVQKPPQQPQQAPVAYDSRELSIQRQVSLKCANDVQVAMTNRGVPMTDAAVLKLATAYNDWLVTGAIPDDTASTEAQSS